MDYKELWRRVLVEMDLGISSANFTTWFKDTRIVKEDSGVVVLSVPNAFVKDWVQTNYSSLFSVHLPRLLNVSAITLIFTLGLIEEEAVVLQEKHKIIPARITEQEAEEIQPEKRPKIRPAPSCGEIL